MGNALICHDKFLFRFLKGAETTLQVKTDRLESKVWQQRVEMFEEIGNKENRMFTSFYM